MKNKKLIIIGILVTILVVVGFFYLGKNYSNSKLNPKYNVNKFLYSNIDDQIPEDKLMSYEEYQKFITREIEKGNNLCVSTGKAPIIVLLDEKKAVDDEYCEDGKLINHSNSMNGGPECTYKRFATVCGNKYIINLGNPSTGPKFYGVFDLNEINNNSIEQSKFNYNDSNLIKKNDDNILSKDYDKNINKQESSDLNIKLEGASLFAPVIVYKTRNDYFNNISVGYKNGKIISYPGPSDAIHQRPILLADGYLLKKMEGNVFLNTTIDEFINAKNNEDWYKYININNILDYNPFIEIYDCPSGIDDYSLNKIILSGSLKSECKDILNNL